MKIQSMYYLLAAIFLTSISSTTWSSIDGQVAIENSTFIKVLIAEKFALIAAFFSILVASPSLTDIRKTVPIGFWIFIGWVFLSSLWSFDSLESLGRAATLLMTTLVPVTSVLVFGAARSLRTFWWFSAGIVLISFFISVSGSPYGIMGGAHAGLWRGIFVHKNHYGVFLAFFLILTVLGVGTPRPIFQWSAAVLCVVQLAEAGSATALVLPFCGIIFGLFFRKTAKMHLSASLIGLLRVAAILLGALVLVPFVPFLLDQLGRDASLTGRVPVWSAAWNYSWQYPFGSGYRTGGGQLALDAIRIGSGWLVAPSTHNGLLTLLLDTGFVGLGLWLLWIVRLILVSTQNDRGPFVRNLPVEAIALTMLVNSQVDSSGGAYPGYPLALLFLLIAARKTLESESVDRVNASKPILVR